MEEQHGSKKMFMVGRSSERLSVFEYTIVRESGISFWLWTPQGEIRKAKDGPDSNWHRMKETVAEAWAYFLAQEAEKLAEAHRRFLEMEHEFERDLERALQSTEYRNWADLNAERDSSGFVLRGPIQVILEGDAIR